ncbi:MAG: nickel ABC transporter ATP-binding protein [Dethiosulfovibrio peptidovorans]|nr:MAG: nickel ABC transporter ATP-binding protein [Dethiosulfovibrio peptidovorans]
MKTLELQDADIGYGATPVLRDISLRLTVTDRLFLKGPNGAGKTTLFRTLVGLLPLQSGSILLDGEPVESAKDWRTLRRQVGLVFQDPDDQLFCPTLLDDVAFGPLNMGLPRSQVKERSHRVLESLGMDHLAEKPPHILSGGQKKLGSLGTVLSMNPAFLLLDEPSAGLDVAATQRLIQALGDFPGGFLVSSHDADFLNLVVSSGLEVRDGTILDERPIKAP